VLSVTILTHRSIKKLDPGGVAGVVLVLVSGEMNSSSKKLVVVIRFTRPVSETKLAPPCRLYKDVKRGVRTVSFSSGVGLWDAPRGETILIVP